MKKNRFAPIIALAGVSVSPRIQTGHDGVFLRSISGNPEQIGRALNQLATSGYDIGSLVALGSGVADDGQTNIHIVLLDVDNDTNLVTARANVDKTMVRAQNQDGYDYANMLGTTTPTGEDEQCIRVASWGNQFDAQSGAQQVFRTTFDSLLDKNGKVGGAKNGTRVILLVGTDDSRITLAAKPGEDFKTLLNTGFDTERHALVGSTLLIGEYGGNKVAGLEAKNIRTWLDGAAAETVQYSFTELRTGGKIVDIAIVDGSQKSTFFTLSGGDFAYMPAGVGWKDEELQLTTDKTKATTVAAVGDNYKPIVRISATTPGSTDETAPRFAITAVDQNGGDKVLMYKDSRDMPAAFTTSATAAARDEVYATA